MILQNKYNWPSWWSKPTQTTVASSRKLLQERPWREKVLHKILIDPQFSKAQDFQYERYINGRNVFVFHPNELDLLHYIVHSHRFQILLIAINSSMSFWKSCLFSKSLRNSSLAVRPSLRSWALCLRYQVVRPWSLPDMFSTYKWTLNHVRHWIHHSFQTPLCPRLSVVSVFWSLFSVTQKEK